MELPKTVRSSAKLAAMRAKLLFDTYNWTWEGDKVPTMNDIEEQYLDLAKGASENETGTSKQEPTVPSVLACGRLTVEYSDENWRFGIELATGYSDEEGLDEIISYSSTPIGKELANKSELGYVVND